MNREAGEAPGIVFHWPRAYDLLLRMVWGRDENQYRAHVLQLAALAPGLAVLDVGCGTGTLAIEAKRLVGEEGRVAGIDASPEMIACANAKASKLGLKIDFVEAPAQDLPFSDASFDAVLSTTVIHCLPEAQRARCFDEMARVLKPDGRLLVVDFGGSAQSKHSLFGHLHAHRRFDLTNERAGVAEAGLIEMACGPTRFLDLHYILATRSGERSKRHAV
jgi:ubiquinone/menaquinone biosynthesis C-methylase UbiE